MGYRHKASQRTGRLGEALCELELKRQGYRMVEKVEAPRTKTGIYLKTCSGDFRAVGPEGRSVLVECKWRDRNLRPSDFQPHQIQSLIDHHAAGGISIIAHCQRDGGCRLMQWPEITPLLGLPY